MKFYNDVGHLNAIVGSPAGRVRRKYLAGGHVTRPCEMEFSYYRGESIVTACGAMFPQCCHTMWRLKIKARLDSGLKIIDRIGEDLAFKSNEFFFSITVGKSVKGVVVPQHTRLSVTIERMLCGLGKWRHLSRASLSEV